MQSVLANVTASVSELRESPATVLDEARGGAVAIVERDQVLAYMVPPATYEALIEAFDDAELASLVRARAGEVPVRVAPDEL